MLAALERHQRFLFNHLSERANSRSHPSLKGDSLKNLADVLYAIYPDRAEANLLMGRALLDKGNLKEARKHLEEALELDRNNQQLLLHSFFQELPHSIFHLRVLASGGLFVHIHQEISQ